MAGRFVAIEGVDGVGKTTQVRLLSESLVEEGFEVLTVREPGGTALGERIRPILLEPEIPLTTEAELLLFLASRVELYEERIAPALAEGQVVISDRYHLSTIVYQGIAGALGEARATELVETILGTRRPQLNIVIRLPLDVCVDRMGSDPDRFESAPERLERVWQGFESTRGIPGDTIVRVDGVGPTNVVQRRIREVLDNAL